MKPVKKKKLIEIEYWDCGIANHTHNTQLSAERCLKERRYAPNDGLMVRNASLMKRLLDGESAESIGQEHGLTSSGVNTAVKSIMRRVFHHILFNEIKLLEDTSFLDTLVTKRERKEEWFEALDIYLKSKLVTNT